MKRKTFLIQMHAVYVPSGEGTVGMAEANKSVMIEGVTAEMYPGVSGDILYIRDEDRSIVFAAEMHQVKFCALHSKQNQLKLIEDRTV